MKNFTKKHGLFAVAAVLLAVAAIFVTITCSNGISDGDDFVIPDGKGAIKLSFNDTVRTILPSGASINNFYSFDFAFTVVSGGTAKTVTGILLADINDAIVLDPGTYNLTVIANVNGDLATYGGSDLGTPIPVAAATGSATGITISAGKITNTSIVLGIYDPSGIATGKFTYTVSGLVPADITTATMTITPIGGVALAPIDIKSFFGGGVQTVTPDLTVGIYYVDFYLVVGDDTVNFRHVLQIYKNMTSNYTFTISMNYFNAVFKGGNITFGDLASVVTYEITHTSGPNTTGTVSTSTINLTRGDIIVFTLEDDSDYDTYVWNCLSSTPVSSTATCTINTTGNGDGSPSETNRFSVARDYILTLVVSQGTNYYSKEIKFNVSH